MRRKVLIIILCFMLTTSLTSCYDAREIDDWAYVYSIGVDKGVADKIRFTIQVPTLKGQTGLMGAGKAEGGAQTKGEFSVISIDCPTLYAGVNMINSSLSRTINYMHTKYMVVSEDMARSGVEQFVNGMRRPRQVRRIMHFIVVRGQASEFIKELDPAIGTALSKSQESMMEQQNETGLFDDTTFGDIIDNIKSTRGMPTAALASLNDFSSYKIAGTEPSEKKAAGDYYAGEIPRSGGEKPEYMGTAIFNADKMVGELNGDETRALLMAKGEFKRASISLHDPLVPELYVTIDVSRQQSRDLKVSFKESKPIVDLKVYLEGDLQNLQSSINYEDEKLKNVLEKSFIEYIKDKLDKTIDKCRNLGCDVFGFGKTASMQFFTIQEWEAYNWNSKFKDAQVFTEIQFTIRRTGTVLKTNPTYSSGEDKE